MSAPSNSYYIASGLSTDATHPTLGFDARVGGAHAAVGPVGCVRLVNDNTSGKIYYFIPPLHGPALIVDANNAPPSTAVWGVLLPGDNVPVRVGTNNIMLVLLVSDGTATTCLCEPEVKL